MGLPTIQSKTDNPPSSHLSSQATSSSHGDGSSHGDIDAVEPKGSIDSIGQMASKQIGPCVRRTWAHTTLTILILRKMCMLASSLFS